MSDRDFPRDEYERRWDRARALMEQAGLDALLVTERSNYRYFTGHRSLQFGNKMRPMLCLLPRDNPPVMVIYGLEILAAREHGWVEDIRGYVDVPFPPGLVAETLADLGLARGRIGCELGPNQRLWLPYQDFEAIKAALPEARFVDASEVLVRCRLLKSEREVARIEQACRISTLAYELILRRVHPGLTIGQCERLCLQALVDAGSDPETPGFVLLDLLGLGQDYVYQPGDLFFCDFGGSYRGYKADIARRATFGPPSDQHRQDHQQIVRITSRVIEAMRPGARVGDLAHLFNREAQAIDYPPLQGTKRIGHGFGLDLQEPPSLNVVDDTLMEPGLVVTAEPRFVRDNVFVMVEENLVIGTDGARVLAGGYEELRAIEV